MSTHSVKRRWLLKSVLALTAATAAVGGGVLWRRGFANARMTPDGRSVFRALARGILGPTLPADPAQRNAMLDQYIVKLEEVLFSMPSARRDQVSLLVGTLANAPTRFLLTSQWTSWDDATDDQVREALENLRAANSRLHNTSFVAARAISCLAFFSLPEHWSLAGYPGPVNI